MPFKDPEKRKQYQQEYKKLNREQINEKRRQNENNKLRSKKYYEEHKDRLNEKHECGCGGCYTTKNKLAHERGYAHIYWSKTGINVNTLPIDYNWYPHLNELMKEDNK